MAVWEGAWVCTGFHMVLRVNLRVCVRNNSGKLEGKSALPALTNPLMCQAVGDWCLGWDPGVLAAMGGDARFVCSDPKA